MGVPIFIALVMIISSCVAEKYKQMGIKIAQERCNKRFKHYYKYEL